MQPIAHETRIRLQQKWNALLPTLQTDRQIYGRHEEGCGATVGAMPRCDFACKGCYLTTQANTTPPLSLDAVKEQLRHLREYLGQWGNLQLTDGELTLRPETELIELIRYAHAIELIPMLMTHGDSFRRRPGLLERLMIQGGLTEISLHIDTTQRGRKGYKQAKHERDLNPLREEFARIVRQARETTGLPLRVAATITVTDQAAEEIPDILACMMSHSDVYRLITFLPIAQVGRTEEGIGSRLTSEAVWDQISTALGFDARQAHWYFGHSSCNRFIMGMLATRHNEPPRHIPLSMAANPDDRRFLDPFFQKFGGLTFRADTTGQKLRRATAMLCQAPGLLTIGALRFGWALLKRIAPERAPIITLLRLATGRIKLHRLTIGTHHFMSREETETPEGRERIDQCIFKVPDGDQMVSMCTFNTAGGRERLYERLRNAPATESHYEIPVL